MSPRRETTDALVLSSADSKDDLIVRLMTPELGNVPAVARRARRSRKRHLGSHLQPLTRIEVTVTLRPDRDLGVIESAEAREPFACVKGDLVRFALASTMAEVALHLVPDHGHEPGMYELLLRALRRLDQPKRKAVEELLLLFEVRALGLAGVMPEVDGLVGLMPGARAVLAGWQEGTWALLAPEDRPRVARVLEGLVEDASGRAVRSRAFLSDVLPPSS